MGNGAQGWQQTQADIGRWLATAKLRSLVDYRPLATRTPQGSRITALIAAD